MPSLLVSLHDVSPLTLDASSEAVRLLRDAGVPATALTVLVVPFHDSKIRIDAHEPTRRFLGNLADAGAQLVMHGYTHRMKERAGPFGWPLAHGFARGQGELYRKSREDTARCLELGREILCAAGLRDATRGFVPPAWLLSRGAAEAVRAADFDFYERFGGVVAQGRLVARRLIGWGALNAIEAWATTVWAQMLARRAPVDTRLAVHPPDVIRARTRASIRKVLARLLRLTEPVTYADCLASAKAMRRTA